MSKQAFSSLSSLCLFEDLSVSLGLVHGFLVNVHVSLETVGDISFWIATRVYFLELLVDDEALQDRVRRHSPHAHEDTSSHPGNNQDSLGAISMY